MRLADWGFLLMKLCGCLCWWWCVDRAGAGGLKMDGWFCEKMKELERSWGTAACSLVGVAPEVCLRFGLKEE
jgi:hypothetical protein